MSRIFLFFCFGIAIAFLLTLTLTFKVKIRSDKKLKKRLKEKKNIVLKKIKKNIVTTTTTKAPVTTTKKKFVTTTTKAKKVSYTDCSDINAIPGSCFIYKTKCGGYEINRKQFKTPNGKNNFENWKQVHYKKCAVVGSGASLLNSKCGKEIDSNDAVFRINTAPSIGFEMDVGTFTTFRVSYGAKCSLVDTSGYLSHGICVASHDGEATVKKLFNLRKQDGILHADRYKEYRDQFTTYTNLKRIRDIHLFFQKSTFASKYYGFSSVKNPTSGFNAILAAFDICDNIFLYGFDYGKSLIEKKNIRKSHYYDYRSTKYNIKKNPHNFIYEWTTMKRMLKKRAVKATPIITPITLEKLPNILFVVPFRDRHIHFDKFAKHIATLKKIKATIYVVEQDNENPFNRGWLLNIGIEKGNKANFDCIVTSDVDIFGNVDYSWCDKPTQICSEMECWNNGVPYHKNAGGVIQARPSDWIKINGYTNNANGWGGEDDDLYHRFRQAKLLTNNILRRPVKGYGKCKCLHDTDHTKRVKTKHYKKILVQLKKMSSNSKQWKIEGLNSLQYDLSSKKRLIISGVDVLWFKATDIVTKQSSVKETYKKSVVYQYTLDDYLPFQLPLHIKTKLKKMKSKRQDWLGYVTILKHGKYYYMMQNCFNQGNKIMKTKDISKGQFKMFNNVRDLDRHGNMAATMTLYKEGNSIFYIGSSASGKQYMPYGDGHYGAILNLTTLKPIKSDLKLVLKRESLDTLPSIVKYNNKYYKYSRMNDRKRHFRYEIVCVSNALFDSTAANCSKIVLKHYNTYSANIFVHNGTFHGFFWVYNPKLPFNYDTFFVLYATSKDGISFDIIKENVGTLIIPINGHIFEHGSVNVYFNDLQTNTIIKKNLNNFII